MLVGLRPVHFTNRSPCTGGNPPGTVTVTVPSGCRTIPVSVWNEASAFASIFQLSFVNCCVPVLSSDLSVTQQPFRIDVGLRRDLEEKEIEFGRGIVVERRKPESTGEHLHRFLAAIFHRTTDRPIDTGR